MFIIERCKVHWRASMTRYRITRTEKDRRTKSYYLCFEGWVSKLVRNETNCVDSSLCFFFSFLLILPLPPGWTSQTQKCIYMRKSSTTQEITSVKKYLCHKRNRIRKRKPDWGGSLWVSSSCRKEDWAPAYIHK